MAPNHQLAFGPLPVQTLDLSDQSLDRKGQRELTSLLSEAVDASRVSEKEAARDMGYDPAYWSRIKAGQKAAHLDRIGRLPEKVQREFVKRYAQELKMRITEEDTERAAALELVETAIRYLRLRA